MTCEPADAEDSRVKVALSNGETLTTKRLIGDGAAQDLNSKAVSKIIAVVSSPLTSLFTSSVKGSPLAAVSIVANSLSIKDATQTHPVYIMVHSSETGECPTGQCVLYATTRDSSSSKDLIKAAVSAFLNLAENGRGKLLFSLYYEEEQETQTSDAVRSLTGLSLDLAFDDKMLVEVEAQWRGIMGIGDGGQESHFMQFEDRKGMNGDDDDDDGY